MQDDDKDYWEDDQGMARPKRTAGCGPWSGLRFSMTAQKIPSYLDAKPGVVVNIALEIILSNFRHLRVFICVCALDQGPSGNQIQAGKL